MVDLQDIQFLRPEGIDFPLDGHTITITPTSETRRLGLGIPDVKLDWRVLCDTRAVGFIEAGQDVILAWKPYELDDGTPAMVTNIEEAVRFLVGDTAQHQQSTTNTH